MPSPSGHRLNPIALRTSAPGPRIGALNDTAPDARWLDLALGVAQQLVGADRAAIVLSAPSSSGRMITHQLAGAAAVPRGLLKQALHRLTARATAQLAESDNDTGDVRLRDTTTRRASFAIAPVEIHGLPGCLVVMREAPRGFTPADTAVLERVSRSVTWLMGRMEDAQVHDRRRLARALHDGLAETLTCLIFTGGELEDAVGARKKRLARSVRLDALRAVQQLRAVISEVAGEDAGERSRDLDDLVRDLQGCGLEVHVDGDLSLEAFPAAVRTCLYEVAREALVNVRRHARATRVDLSLRRLASGITLTVADNGTGYRIEPAGCGRSQRGFGVRFMQERVEEAGGTFRLESAPCTAVGTRMTVWLPCERAASPGERTDR